MSEVTCFDGISKELKSKLVYREVRVKKHLAAAKRSLFDLSEEFAGARDDCNAANSDATFAKWADQTFGMSRSSAYRIVSVFDRIVSPYVGTGSDLNFIGFDDYALYDLAQTTTPEKAIKDAIKIAKKGGRLTHKQAKELIASYAVEVEEPEPEPEDEPQEDEQHDDPEPEVEQDDDDNTIDAESVTPTAEPCPNCGGTDWEEDEFGMSCVACSHPHGEPLGDLDPGDPEWKTLRSKAVKTAEALLRAVDDLHDAKAKRVEHANVIATIKIALKAIQDW